MMRVMRAGQAWIALELICVGVGKGISGKPSERTVTGQDLGELVHLPGNWKTCEEMGGHGTRNSASTSWQATRYE